MDKLEDMSKYLEACNGQDWIKNLNGVNNKWEHNQKLPNEEKSRTRRCHGEFCQTCEQKLFTVPFLKIRMVPVIVALVF